MKSLFSLALLYLIAGCNAVSDVQNKKNDVVIDQEPSQFFIIQGREASQQVTPIFENGQLLLGAIKISHWPNIKLACKACRVSKGRKDFFNGSTVWLNITGKNQSTLLVTSFQRRDFIDPWHITYENDGLLIEDRKAGVKSNIAYDVSLPISIKGTGCELVWLKREKQDSAPAGISNDVPDYKTQIIIQCK